MKIYLAPMEGVVDHHMRHLLSQIGGIDICVTEFIRVTDHRLPTKVFLRYSPELLLNENIHSKKDITEYFSNNPKQNIAHITRTPTRIQLLGNNPSALADNARKAAALGAPAIDLNFGCPAKTVNKHKGGACLLNEPNTLYDIVKAVRQAVPAHTPVTAKIRLGYDDRSSYLENSQAIFDAGANELIVHARSKVDGYKPPAYWEYIADIKAAISIPVIANGDIWSVEDYLRCKEQSGCDDVMLGRGLLSRPDLALAIKKHVEGKDYQPMTWEGVAAIVLDFFVMTCDAYPQKYLGNRVKQWLFYLKNHYVQAAKLFEEIKKEREYSHILSKLQKATEK